MKSGKCPKCGCDDIHVGSGLGGIGRNRNILRISFLEFAELENYVSRIYETIDSDLGNEVASALTKMVALHAGNHVGYWYATALNSGRRDSHESWLLQMDKMLQSGI